VQLKNTKIGIHSTKDCGNIWLTREEGVKMLASSAVFMALEYCFPKECFPKE